MYEKFEIKNPRPAQKMVMAITRKMRGLPLLYVKHVLSRNIITIKQLSEITGHTENRISVMSLQNPRAHEKSCKLTRVYPFQSKEHTGPIFILRDEQCDQFILECNK